MMVARPRDALVLPLGRDASSRFGPWIVGAMVYVASIALAGAMMLSSVSEHWQSDRLGGHYAQVAEALGAHATRVETPKTLAPAIQQALAANREGRTAVLEVMTRAEENVAKFW